MDTAQLKTASQRQKNKIIISTIFGNLGSSIFSFGLSLLILKETGSATNFGISFVIAPVLAVIFMPFIGGFVDKYDRKKIALFAQTVITVAVLLFALLYHRSNIPKILLVYGIIIVMKITDIIFATAYIGAMSRMVEKEQQLSLMSVMNIISYANVLIASFLGAAMYEYLPFLVFILFEATTELIGLVITTTLDFELLAEEPSEETEKVEQQSVFALFISGIQYILSRKVFLYLVVFLVTYNIISPGSFIGTSFLSVHFFNLRSTEFGGVRMMVSAGFILASVILSRKKTLKNSFLNAQRFLTLLSVVYILWAVLMHAALPYWGNVAVIAGLNFIHGFSQGMILTPLNSWTIRNVPQAMQGRMFNIQHTLAQLFQPFSILILGFLLDYFRGDIIITVLGILGISCAILLPRLFQIRWQDMVE